MRDVILLATGLAMLAVPAFAQSDEPPSPQPVTHHRVHHHHVSHHAASGGEKPIDNGPTSPDSDKAYQGGGVVLQGAPGGPAPTPQATPPGQMPAGTVPHP